MPGSNGERIERNRAGGSISPSRTAESARSRLRRSRTRSSKGGSRAAECDLRRGVPRLLVWVPARTRAHDALDALLVGIDGRRVNFILDADIRSFFDEVSQEWLIRFVEHRIGDKRIIRLILKWLKAGILEDGVVSVSDRGTGQGSVTRRSWPTSTCTTFSTSGPSAGDGGRPRAT